MSPESANQRMVDCLIAEGALWSQPVIQAFRRMPRHRFLQRVFLFQRKQGAWRAVDIQSAGETGLRIAYVDRALVTHLSDAGRGDPISSSSQPSLMAEMLQDLRVDMGHRVLEIGAGTGYNAALLAEIVGPGGHVTSVDVDESIVAEARRRLDAVAPLGPVELVVGDGRGGHPARAPFDRIMVTASTTDLEPAWLEQVAPGGLLLAPVAFAPGLAYLVRGTMHGPVFHGRLTRPAYFMPLRPAAYVPLDACAPKAAQLLTVPAPWAGWFGRRRTGASWLSFSLALALHAWLRGLRVSQHTEDKNTPCFAISDSQDDNWVQLGWHAWRCHGPSAARLAHDLWRSFLNQGGPRPTDYRIRAYPADQERPAAQNTVVTALPRYVWHWELSEARDRPSR